MDKLNETLELYLVKKAPALPPGAKEVIVKFGPWITLVLLILALPAVLVLFGLGTFLAPFAYLGGVGLGTSYTVSLVILAVSLVLEALAIPGLFNRTKQGWNFIYYSTLVSFVSSIMGANPIGAIVSVLIGLYILFQIRSYYH